MLEGISDFVTSLAAVLPLELFVFVGSFLEEIIAPVPSVLITTLAGSLAEAAGYGWFAIVWLAVLAAVGKSIGCAILYVLGDKAEDVIMTRFGSALGITHAEVERVGRFFKGGLRDYLILIVVRALPLSPSLPISVGAGIIKIPFTLYNIATLIGNFLRSILFLAVGYTGFAAYQNLLEEADSLSSVIQIVLAALLALFVLGVYYVRMVRSEPSDRSRGFTLIEVMVAISIMALLSSIIFASVVDARQRSMHARAATDIRTLHTALQFYLDDRGKYPPSSTQGLLANTTNQGSSNWHSLMGHLDPYLSAPLVPAFPSEGNLRSLLSGYSYAKGTASNPARFRTWNGTTGDFVACLFVYDGYWLDFGMPTQSSFTLNDNGIDPDGIEVFAGTYTITTNPADCNF